MGDKIRARDAVAARGVPVVPGLARPGLTDEELAAAVADIGFPVLIKPSAGGGGKSGGGATAVEAVAHVPTGCGVIKGDLVITQPQAGTFKAFSKVCTHAGCDVNKVDGGVISCPCHGSTFSIEDGSPTGGPATKPLAETKVKVDGGNVVKA
jgi:Rieske Fe-S protein